MRHRIAVVGAGPGGLTLARVLHRHGHPVTVLERDTAPDARPLGGTLDLHENLGQRAIAQAGLTTAFERLARPEGQAMRILGTDGTVLRDWRPRPGERANPEIDRGQLRDLLLGPLDVQWGTNVTEVVPDAPGGVLVRSADGSARTYDLVVGADGAWSRVRGALSPATPATPASPCSKPPSTTSTPPTPTSPASSATAPWPSTASTAPSSPSATAAATSRCTPSSAPPSTGTPTPPTTSASPDGPPLTPPTARPSGRCWKPCSTAGPPPCSTCCAAAPPSPTAPCTSCRSATPGTTCPA
ncbi:FAD-dependent oxidoreductase [Nonomuraea salmonea]|uniref:FAD-dependent oxidoreductase n=1 Tax=Nonomuraea salmonea TaxID=46181 RepID=UPI0036190927